MTRSDRDADLLHMKRAIALARRGQGCVEPNPMVGCVLVKLGRVVAEGYHRRYGGPHAEVEALRRAGRRAKNATAYVTLEPCSHFGKTPPCADALIAAGVSRVVIAMRDPFPEVSGRGITMLRRAGVSVEVGLCRQEAVDLNAPYLTLLEQGRPHVILKWAQSIDGKIATYTGDSQWISCPASRRRVHRIRARVDGVVVGIGTVLWDDPLLTARDVPLRRLATRIVLDTQLRLPLKSQLVRTAFNGSTASAGTDRKTHAPVLVFTSKDALRNRQRHAEYLRRRGVEVVPCPVRGDRINLSAALKLLGKRRMTNVLVEGGGQVLGDLLDRRLADEAYIFISPKLIGGVGAVSALGGRGTKSVAEAWMPRRVTTSRVGSDTLMHVTF